MHECSIDLINGWPRLFVCYVYCNATPTAGTRYLFETRLVLTSEPGELSASKWDQHLFGGGFYSSIYGKYPFLPGLGVVHPRN